MALLGGNENQQYLLSIASGKRLPELRTTAIDALININLPLAAKSAVALLQNPPANTNVNDVLSPFLARRQGPRFLAQALQGASLSPEIATIGVRRAMSLSQKNPGLIAAFQKAGKLDPVGKEMSPEELKKLNVEFIEQPLPREEWDAMQQVYENSALPIIADESCIEEEDVTRCRGLFHGVNVKLIKCGGITPARRMCLQAKEYDLKLMVGCMTESSIGIAAAAQLLPYLDYADLDGALLLAKDIARGVQIDCGNITFSELHGNGVELI